MRDNGDRLTFEMGTGYLIARLGSLAERSWAGMLRSYGLTPHQHGVLLALRERGPMGQQSLSRYIAVDPRNIVPILDGLTDRQLIHRQIDPLDRRRRVLAMTPTGQAIADNLAKSAATIEREFLAGVDPADQAELNRLLRLLYASLSFDGVSRRTAGGGG